MQAIRLRRAPVTTAATLALACVAALFLSRRAPNVQAALWAALMIVSFLGWGSLVNRWLAPGRRIDWGLRAGWGMGLVIVTGGFLCLLHLAVRPVLAAQVAAGPLVLLGHWAVRPSPFPSRTRARRRTVVVLGRAGLFAVVAAAYALAVLALFASLGNHAFQTSDDPTFYMLQPEKLVQTGSMFEPFAARRASSFGGQVYLHAAFISVASVYYLNAVDGGISVVLVVALLVGYVGRSSLRPWHAMPIGLATLLLFTLQPVRVNTASLMSGVAAILTLYRTVREPSVPAAAGLAWVAARRRIVVVAGLTVVCILLRTSNAAAVLPFVVLVFALDFLLRTRRPWSREALAPAARAVGLFVLAFACILLPWSILLERSCGSFFYPLGHSNITPGWTFLAHPRNLAAEVVTHLFHGRPVGLFVVFAFAGLVPVAGRTRNDLVALTVATLIALVVQSWQSAAFGATNTARYYFAYIVATSLLVTASVGRGAATGVLVAAGLGMHLALSRDPTRDTLTQSINQASGAMFEFASNRQSFEATTEEYVDIQSHVPAGATMVTAVFQPFRFDFKRNQVFVLDFLGGMGPEPGWPFGKGPAALGDYLLANGVQYLVWVDFNLPNEFYNRAHWKEALTKKPEHYLAGEAPFLLDAEDMIEQLTTMRRVVYRAHDMTVVDLSAMP
jgi:hypothetical protein